MSQCTGVRKGKVVDVREFQNRQSAFTDNYEIEFRNDGTCYWIYCNLHPDNRYDKGLVESHLHPCCGQICVQEGREPKSMEMAEAIAHYWMAGYSEMARTGVFRDDGGSVDV